MGPLFPSSFGCCSKPERGSERECSTGGSAVAYRLELFAAETAEVKAASCR